MSLASFCTAYLGVLLWYLASEKHRRFVAPGWQDVPSRTFRVSGSFALALALVLFALTFNPAEAVLVWLSVLVSSASVIAIAAPLAPRSLLTLTSVALFVTVVALLGQVWGNL